LGTLYVLAVIALALWILLTLGFVIGILRAVPALRRFDAMVSHVERLLRTSEGRLEPVLDHLEDAADDIRFVTSSLRMDVQNVGRAVERATDSVEDILAMAEERAAEINGLLAVVQEEAEDTFLSTASVLRALRGARRRRGRRESGPSGRRSA
jgi:methyl-accepting chemotaxis protein